MYTLTAGIDAPSRDYNAATPQVQTENSRHAFVNRLASVGNACLAPLKKTVVKACQLADKHPKLVLMLTAVVSTTFAANQLIAGNQSLYAFMIIAGPSAIGAGIVGAGHLVSGS